MSDFRIDQITNQAGTAGPDIAGMEEEVEVLLQEELFPEE
jgi:hypothetical protein